MKKGDKRKDNGSESRGLMEASLLIRGPSELFDAVREYAEEHGHSIAWVWRTAAAEFLKRHAK